MTDNVLRLDAWISPEGSTDFLLTTDRVPGHVTGGQIHPDGKGRYRLSMSAAGGMADRASGYVRRTVIVELPPLSLGTLLR